MTEIAISVYARVRICVQRAFKSSQLRSPSAELCSKEMAALVSFRQYLRAMFLNAALQAFVASKCDFGVIKKCLDSKRNSA